MTSSILDFTLFLEELKGADMNSMTLLAPTKIDKDVIVFNGYIPLPGFGMLPGNAFLIKSASPVMVNTGAALLREGFFHQLEQEIPLEDIKWIWITHTDPDHIGNLPALLELAPRAKVVTNYLGMVKMGLLALPPERMHLMNPGDKLNVGDRELLAMVPPTIDAPETCGLYDLKSKNLFAADSFGAVLQTPATYADDIEYESLREGVLTWCKLGIPWLQNISETKFLDRIEQFRNLQTNWILSSRLPPAQHLKQELLSILEESLRSVEFTPPNQRGLELLLQSALNITDRSGGLT